MKTPHVQLPILTAIAAALLGGPLLVGCAEPVGPGVAAENRATEAVHGNSSAVQDISGAWTFRRELFIHLTELAAVIFGLEPEGPRTTIHCSATGSMTIAQNGAAFTGSLTQESVCVSRGGQQFAMSEENAIADGVIHGRNLSFTLMGEPGPVACPARGAITSVNGAAVAMRGNWQCQEPGHPQSVWEGLSPPRLGPSLATWEATR